MRGNAYVVHLKYNTICPFPTKICKKLHWTEKPVINYVTESNDQSFYVILPQYNI